MRLKCVDAVRVKKEWTKAHKSDAVVVHPRLFVGLAGNDDFAKAIFDESQRFGFLRALFGSVYHEGGLDVHTLGSLVDNEVDFVHDFLPNIVASWATLHNSNIYAVTTTNKFIVYHIFHYVGRLDLPVAKTRIANSGVGGIALEKLFKVSTAFNVVAFSTLDKEGIFEISNIARDNRMVGIKMRYGVNGVRNLVWIYKSANGTHDRIGKRGKKFVILEVVPVGNVTKINCGIEIVKIVPLPVFVGNKCTFRKSPVEKIFLKNLGEIKRFVSKRIELCKGKRRHLDNFATATKYRRHIGRKKFGIGTGYISSDIVAVEKSVQNIIESREHVFPIVGMDSLNINAFRQSFFGKLDFVNKDVFHLPVIFKFIPYDFIKRNSVSDRTILARFEIDLNDMIAIDTGFKKMFFKEIKKKITLAATSHASENLHEMMRFGLDEAIEKYVSLDGHSFAPVFNIGSMDPFLNTRIVYHISAVDVNRAVGGNEELGMKNEELRRAA